MKTTRNNRGNKADLISPALTNQLSRLWWGFLGLLFLWAGVSKILHPADFLASIYAFKLPIPDGGGKLIALVLPWFEVLSGILLLVGYMESTMRALCMGLLGVFVLATGQAWFRGLDLSCGCFELGFLSTSVSSHLESAGFAFGRNLFLFAISIYFARPSAKILSLTEAECGG